LHYTCKDLSFTDNYIDNTIEWYFSFFFQDEEPETSWMLIQENDLVALFSQFPFDAIFKHLLKMDPNIHSKLHSGLFTLLPTIILSSMLFTKNASTAHDSDLTFSKFWLLLTIVKNRLLPRFRLLAIRINYDVMTTDHDDSLVTQKYNMEDPAHLP